MSLWAPVVSMEHPLPRGHTLHGTGMKVFRIEPIPWEGCDVTGSPGRESCSSGWNQSLSPIPISSLTDFCPVFFLSSSPRTLSSSVSVSFHVFLHSLSPLFPRRLVIFSSSLPASFLLLHGFPFVAFRQNIFTGGLVFLIVLQQ